MTFHLTAHENTRARLIASETRTDDADIAALVREHYERQGWIVVQRVEH
jgi:hypothetical protein